MSARGGTQDKRADSSFTSVAFRSLGESMSGWECKSERIIAQEHSVYRMFIHTSYQLRPGLGKQMICSLKLGKTLNYK